MIELMYLRVINLNIFACCQFGCSTSSRFQLIFVTSFLNRFLVDHTPNATVPKDAKRLRITGRAFRAVLSHFEAPPAFLWALSKPDLPFSHGQVRQESSTGTIRHLWYILSVRTQVSCTNKERSHALSAAGSNQLDPSHYLHLDNAEVDIRGSQIGLYWQYDESTGATSVLCLNLQDGRWKKIAEEPQKRTAEVLQHAGPQGEAKCPFFIHLVLFSSVVRWWSNVLSGFNEQLMAHVSFPTH
jgi:hypothetical protein